jgi:hypothetical protein
MCLLNLHLEVAGTSLSHNMIRFYC